MDIGVQIVFDAADPPKLAEFWMAALDYVPEPPPQGFDSWDDFGHHIGMPEEQFGDQATAVDPAGVRPRLYFQKVPEGKTAGGRHPRFRDCDARPGGQRILRVLIRAIGMSPHLVRCDAAQLPYKCSGRRPWLSAKVAGGAAPPATSRHGVTNSRPAIPRCRSFYPWRGC
jgi:hypothetical protein